MIRFDVSRIALMAPMAKCLLVVAVSLLFLQACGGPEAGEAVPSKSPPAETPSADDNLFAEDATPAEQSAVKVHKESNLKNADGVVYAAKDIAEGAYIEDDSRAEVRPIRNKAFPFGGITAQNAIDQHYTASRPIKRGELLTEDNLLPHPKVFYLVADIPAGERIAKKFVRPCNMVPDDTKVPRDAISSEERFTWFTTFAAKDLKKGQLLTHPDVLSTEPPAPAVVAYAIKPIPANTPISLGTFKVQKEQNLPPNPVSLRKICSGACTAKSSIEPGQPITWDKIVFAEDVVCAAHDIAEGGVVQTKDFETKTVTATSQSEADNLPDYADSRPNWFDGKYAMSTIKKGDIIVNYATGGAGGCASFIGDQTPRTVAYAKQEIPAGTFITAPIIEAKQLAESQIPEETFQPIGYCARKSIKTGQLIRGADLIYRRSQPSSKVAFAAKDMAAGQTLTTDTVIFQGIDGMSDKLPDGAADFAEMLIDNKKHAMKPSFKARTPIKKGAILYFGNCN